MTENKSHKATGISFDEKNESLRKGHIDIQMPDHLPTLTCKRCGHKWIPRTDQKPRMCPNRNCRSAYWDRPRQRPYTKRGQPYRFAEQEELEESDPVIGVSQQVESEEHTQEQEVTDTTQVPPLIGPAPPRLVDKGK